MIFSSTCGTFCKTDHMLGHKTSLNKYKKTEIILNIFSDDNGIKLEINYKQEMGGKKPRRLNSMLLNNQWVTEEIKGKIKKIYRQMKPVIAHNTINGM